MTAQLLEGVRVLDLTDDKGLLCGKLLADMGADVIVLEPPGGNAARNLGPFYRDRPGPETSLYWWAYNTNKRSAVLDLQQADGRALFRRLVQTADIVVESFAPGALDALGLGYSALQQLNPRLILASITGFGQTGPYKDYQAPDIVGSAMGGFTYLSGDADRHPVRVGLPQAYFHAAAEAVVGTMVAYYERQQSGLGQHVDVSMQTCVIGTLMNASPFPQLHGENVTRGGIYLTSLGGKRRMVYPCKDGYLSFLAIGGVMGAHAMHELTAWMASENMAPDDFRAMDWDTWDVVAVMQAEDGQQQVDMVEAAVGAFFMAHTKEELYEGSIARRILLAPISDMRDIAENKQLADRGYFVDLAHDALGETIRYPGAFGKFSETPLQITRHAPHLGEHNQAIYGDELGLLPEEMMRLHELGVISATPRQPAATSARVTVRAPVAPSTSNTSLTAPTTPHPKPFEGLRMVDFTWYGVGPITTKYLSDFGAEVIKIESYARPDLIRWAPPWRDAVPDLDSSQFFANYNTGKMGVSLDLNKPEAREIAMELVKTADVVAESFSPRAMRKWGLDYPSLVAIKPDIVMFSTCQQGQTGPHSGFVGTGNLLAALCGFYQVMGYEGGEPLPIYGAYTDFIVPRIASSALIAALDHRRRTGQGQYIDLSQFETSLHFLTPILMDYQINGRIADRTGNRDPQAAPHGIYRCQGEDRWCAIAVSTDVQWQALCEQAGHADWLGDERFASQLQRLYHAAALDQHIESWTCTQDAADLMHRLQAAGVPAGVVQPCSDLYHDPQLAHRGYYVELEHASMGRTLYDGPQFHLSRTPADLRPSPLLGQHNDAVLKGILGMSDAEVKRLIEAAVVY